MKAPSIELNSTAKQCGEKKKAGRSLFAPFCIVSYGALFRRRIQFDGGEITFDTADAVRVRRAALFSAMCTLAAPTRIRPQGRTRRVSVRGLNRKRGRAGHRAARRIHRLRAMRNLALGSRSIQAESSQRCCRATRRARVPPARVAPQAKSRIGAVPYWARTRMPTRPTLAAEGRFLESLVIPARVSLDLHRAFQLARRVWGRATKLGMTNRRRLFRQKYFDAARGCLTAAR